MLIKICGIKDPEIAAFAAHVGAHYIGMILTPGFRRSIELERGKLIAEAARKAGAEPVGVFVAADSLEIENACSFLGIQLVQPYQLSGSLPKHLKRIFINEPNAALRPNQDFLLMEGGKPGSGKRPKNLTPPLIKPWFIGGGLNPENVKFIIAHYRPNGVDVSSGVERDGVKNQELILKFIQEVNHGN